MSAADQANETTPSLLFDALCEAPGERLRARQTTDPARPHMRAR